MNAVAQIKLACPHCGQHVACDFSLANTQLPCPACGKLFSVPALPKMPAASPASEEKKTRFEAGPFWGTLALLVLLIAVPIVVRLSMDPMWRLRSARMSPADKQQLSRIIRKKPDLKYHATIFGAYCVVGFGAFYLVRSNATLGRFRVAPWIISGLCVASAFALEHKPPPPRPKPLPPAGKNVVPPKTGTPLLGTIKPTGDTQFRNILVYNPPDALTIVLELKSTIPNYFRQGRYFRGGVAVIKFDTDNNPATGAPDPKLEGFDTHAVLDMAAVGDGETSPWLGAFFLGEVDEHRVESELAVYDAGRDRFEGVTAGIYDHASINGDSILVTFTYSELKVRRGQTIRVGFLDRGKDIREEAPFGPVQVTLK